MLQNKSAIQKNYIFGLDIGTRSLVGIVGYPVKEQFVVVAEYTLLHDTRAMIDGQIYDIEKVTESVKYVKYQLEKQLGFSLEKVCIAAAGRVLITKTVHVEQDTDINTTIEEERILTLELLGIERAHMEIQRDLQDFDSRLHCVAYTVSKYYLNNYEISKLTGQRGKKIGADVLATFLPKEVIESLYKVVEDAGLEVASLTLEPIASIHLAIPPNFRLLNIALVDIGAGTSDIAITKGGNIVAYGMIPFAGDEITEFLVNEYLVDFQTAENIKIKASGKTKSISYKDIMGIQHKVSAEEPLSRIEPTTKILADSIGKRIKELNNGQSTNAVFIVGGGGQIPYFTKLLAQSLGISEERVALRGKTVLNDIHFETSTKKSPILVTPLGICLCGLDEKRKDFMHVYLNDEPIKVYNNNHLTVIDIAAYKEIDPKSLIANRGRDLTFFVNNNEKIIKGFPGEPAKIYINHIPASLNDFVNMNDYIVITEAQKGKDAALSTNQLVDQIQPIHIKINSMSFDYKYKLILNGNLVNMNYDIKNGDKIQTVQPTFEDLFLAFQIPFPSTPLYVNGKEKNMKEFANDHDHIVFETNIKDTKPKEETNTITVVVNGEKILLSGKKSYVFVDIFDKISFDLSKPKGNIICKVNQETVEYMAPLHDQDELEVYWQ